MIDWSDNEHQAALLRLAHRGALKRGRAIDDLVATLLADGWVIQSPRSREVALVEYGRTHLLHILDTRWPFWRQIVQELSTRSLPITARTLVERDKQADYRANDWVTLPPVVNRKTYSALFKRDSKRLAAGALTAGVAGAAAVILTNDSGLQLRTHAGARLYVEGRELDCDALMATLQMVYLPERTLRSDWSLAGALPSLVLTVENLASFYDLAMVPGVLAILVEGWNTSLALEFLRRLPATIRLAHFGDYDAAALRIYKHLRDVLGREIALVAPPFALEYLASHARRVAGDVTPWRRAPAEPDEPELLRRLRQSNQWLEQEAITLDGRLVEALKMLTERA
jgi:hypothetical protein